MVLSSSMKPKINAGDLVVVKELDTYILKEGDNNEVRDEFYVVPSQVEGLYQFSIRKLGNIVLEIQKTKNIVICISIPLIFLTIIITIENRKEKQMLKIKEEEIERLKKK